MPIHHKALDKRRIPRKNKPLRGDEYISRSKTFATFKRGNSKSDLKPEPVRPTTPKYLKENFDYDKSSSSEDNGNTSDDGMNEDCANAIKKEELIKRVFVKEVEHRNDLQIPVKQSTNV